MTTMTARRRTAPTREQIKQARERMSDDWIIAGAAAGHTLAQMPPTSGDIEAARRMLSGETTMADERQRILDEILGSDAPAP